eukprot:scaffold132373_cov30-Tisochrysis_lutea.AAC.1
MDPLEAAATELCPVAPDGCSEAEAASWRLSEVSSEMSEAFCSRMFEMLDSRSSSSAMGLAAVRRGGGRRNGWLVAASAMGRAVPGVGQRCLP